MTDKTNPDGRRTDEAMQAWPRYRLKAGVRIEISPDRKSISLSAGCSGIRRGANCYRPAL